ncbi:probable RNA polymerase II nuclear localization protein SLC7A6OS [Rhea pennata]|uniref:probable RNA polymerase II nuclear localization protein SLC7A6OS n=1 Tax=Rhea pennata TaxID=8795 RepID=UPI002E25B602
MERAAVLRVKRKRGGPEPAEALLLARKRRRAEPGGPPGPPRLETGLFKLVATVSSKSEPVQKYVQDVISREKAARSLRPSSGSAQRVLRELRSAREASRKESRYRVVASHRPPACHARTAAAGARGEASADGAAASGDASGAGSSAAAGSGCSEKFQLFDIVQEEEAVGAASVTAANPQKTGDPDVILCNAVEMIRERLNVSEDSNKVEHREKEDEYVYDIYYMETSAPGWIQNILSVQPYKEEYELVDDDGIPGEIYEDEDDENDENNWRNDYPDEDEFLPEEDGDGEKDSEESLSDEDQCFRRTWNKYRHEVLQEFGYDEVQDLDSD